MNKSTEQLAQQYYLIPSALDMGPSLYHEWNKIAIKKRIFRLFRKSATFACIDIKL